MTKYINSPVIVRDEPPHGWDGRATHKGQLYIDTGTGRLYQSQAEGYNVDWKVLIAGSELESTGGVSENSFLKFLQDHDSGVYQLLVDEFARSSEENTFSKTQTFDETEGFAIGNKLKLSFVDGFFGQRLHLTGLPQAPGEDDIMPYFEVVPTTQTGTDVGGAIAGLQVYRTLGGGGVPNREFLAIEASGDLASSVGFKIATWASGTGEFQPIRFVIGSNDIVTMEAPSGVTPRMRVSTAAQIYSLGANPIFFERESGLTALKARIASDANAGPWTFMGRNRGTRQAPAAPVGGDILGEHRFGSLNTSTSAEVPSSMIRALATENWVYGTDQGSLMRFRITPNDSASMIDALDLKDPTDPNDTAFMVLVNRAGVKTVSRVAIGAVDSGGTGYRMLRVAN